MLQDYFSKINLTSSQSEILDYLYHHQDAKASEIAQKISKSRAIVYKEIDNLIDLDLVIKKDRPNQPTVFSAAHPSMLQVLVEAKEKQWQKDKDALLGFLPGLISSYNLVSGRPGIRFYEGVDGLKSIYDEIIEAGQDFYLIRTAYEPVYNDKVSPIVDSFIKERVKKNIHVTALIPSDVDDKEKDAKWLMTRFNIDPDCYTAPVEIDIFGDKVAMLSFGEELIGVVIESKQIAQSLKQLFSLIVKK